MFLLRMILYLEKKLNPRLNNPYFDNKKTDYLSINLINKDGKVDENRQIMD